MTPDDDKKEHGADAIPMPPAQAPETRDGIPLEEEVVKMAAPSPAESSADFQPDPEAATGAVPDATPDTAPEKTSGTTPEADLWTELQAAPQHRDDAGDGAVSEVPAAPPTDLAASASDDRMPDAPAFRAGEDEAASSEAMAVTPEGCLVPNPTDALGLPDVTDSPDAPNVTEGEKGKKRSGLGFMGRKKTTVTKTAAPQPGTPKPAKAKAAAPGFLKSHPLQRVEPAVPCACSKMFNVMALLPWLFLSLMLAAQTVFTLDARALWFSDEIRHAAAFTAMLENGKWFVLEMNGHLYPDKPPLYFWFLRGLYLLLGKEGPFLYFAAAAVSGLLYLWSALALGRFAGRMDGRTLLAGGIMLLGTGYVMGVMHYARMDLLFSAAIILSHTAFFVAWSRPRSYLFMVLAFLLAAVACLIKGPLGLLFPLFTSIVFLVWRGKALRFFKLDVLAGLVVFMAVIAAWAVGVFMETNSTDFLLGDVFQKHILQRAVDTFHHKEGWAYYLERLPLMLLPWTILVLCLPWHRLFGKNMRQAVAASRTPEKEGLAFLWCMALTPVPLLSVLSGKILIYYLPALPALMLLAGRAVLQLSARRAALFRALLMLLLTAGAVGLVVAALFLFGLLDTPAWIKGLPAWELPMNASFYLVAALLLVTAFALWLVLRASSPEGILIIMALGSIAVSVPLFKWAAPSLDQVLSPKAQAEVMKSYVEKGYRPASLKVYGGTYTYYAGTVVDELASEAEAAQLIRAEGKVVIGMRLSRFEEWADKPECLTEVHRQWIETKEYVLAACPALPAAQTSTPDAASVVKEDPASAEESAAAVQTEPEAQSESSPGEPAARLEQPQAVPAPERPSPVETFRQEQGTQAPHRGTPSSASQDATSDPLSDAEPASTEEARSGTSVPLENAPSVETMPPVQSSNASQPADAAHPDSEAREEQSSESGPLSETYRENSAVPVGEPNQGGGQSTAPAPQ